MIINEYLAPFIRNYEGGCSLIQDNDSKHKSHICNAALFNNNIRWIKIPPYSPDISILNNCVSLGLIIIYLTLNLM